MRPKIGGQAKPTYPQPTARPTPTPTPTSTSTSQSVGWLTRLQKKSEIEAFLPFYQYTQVPRAEADTHGLGHTVMRVESMDPARAMTIKTCPVGIGASASVCLSVCLSVAGLDSGLALATKFQSAVQAAGCRVQGGPGWHGATRSVKSKQKQKQKHIKPRL